LQSPDFGVVDKDGQTMRNFSQFIILTIIIIGYQGGLDIMKYTNKILAGILIFTGTALFLFGIIISEAFYPGYRVTSVISDLGVGPGAWFFNLLIIIFGIFLVISSYLLLNIATDRFFSALLGLAGIGATLVGLIPETNGTPHVIAATITFISGGICAIMGYKIFRGPFSIISPFLGSVALLATVLLASRIYFGLGAGGMERIIVYPLIIWGLGAGAYLMSPGK
jgi:hypothetical membrane protein